MRRPLICVLLLVFLLAFPSIGFAKWDQVAVNVPIPPKIKVDPGEKVLVTLARSTDHWRLDVGRELSRWIRRELGRSSSLKLLDVPPPPIPEQRAEALAVNDLFWRRLGEDYQADIVVAAIVNFNVEDRSGYMETDSIHPITGQTYRSTQYVERTGFKMRVHIFFFKGDNGALLHNDIWTEERILDNRYAEDLNVLFELLEGMRKKLLGVVVPLVVAEPRYIWVD